MGTGAGGSSFDLSRLESISDIFVRLVLTAGRTIMRIRDEGAHVRHKADNSPVCEADEQAEAIILSGLGTHLPELNVVAEEAVAAGQAPGASAHFILVDPLDGTKEFIAGREQFTVNIALIENGRPILGVVYAPALGRIWRGARDNGGAAFAQTSEVASRSKDKKADGWSDAGEAADLQWREIATRAGDTLHLTILCSLSHLDNATDRFIQNLAPHKRLNIGSSSKFCLIASGEADVYPRLSATMEWDIAAGDAILRAAGGMVVDDSGAPMQYGKAEFRNTGFFAWGDPSTPDRLKTSG